MLPFRFRPAVFVHLRLLLGPWVVVEGNDGVQVLLTDQLDVLEVLCGYDRQIQRSTLHRFKEKIVFL